MLSKNSFFYLLTFLTFSKPSCLLDLLTLANCMFSVLQSLIVWIKLILKFQKGLQVRTCRKAWDSCWQRFQGNKRLFAVCLGFNIHFVRPSVEGCCENTGWSICFLVNFISTSSASWFWTVRLVLAHVLVPSLRFHFLLKCVLQVENLLLAHSVLAWIPE